MKNKTLISSQGSNGEEGSKNIRDGEMMRRNDIEKVFSQEWKRETVTQREREREKGEREERGKCGRSLSKVHREFLPLGHHTFWVDFFFNRIFRTFS